MMRVRPLCLLGLVFSPLMGFAQVPATDILLLDLPRPEAEDYALRARNITNRPGYDNQPAFTHDGRSLLYTSIRDGEQADIYRFDLATGATHRVTRTPESEYSPTPLPDGGFSTVRVEADSTQRLWQFDSDGSQPKLVLEDVEAVGYHAWLDTHRVALFIVGDPHRLVVADRLTGRIDTVAYNVGRSLHRIPGTNTLSFVDKTDGRQWVVRSYDPASGEDKEVAPTMSEREDYAWTPDGMLLMASGPTLYRWSPEQASWQRIASLEGAGVTEIGRIAVSPDGDRLALVVEEQ